MSCGWWAPEPRSEQDTIARPCTVLNARDERRVDVLRTHGHGLELVSLPSAHSAKCSISFHCKFPNFKFNITEICPLLCVSLASRYREYIARISPPSVVTNITFLLCGNPCWLFLKGARRRLQDRVGPVRSNSQWTTLHYRYRVPALYSSRTRPDSGWSGKRAQTRSTSQAHDLQITPGHREAWANNANHVADL